MPSPDINRDSAPTLYQQVYACLMEKDATEKAKRTRALVLGQVNGAVVFDKPPSVDLPNPDAIAEPGIPDNVRLVAPRKLARRSVHTQKGHAALIHSIVHIEFNAINLALDAVYRFSEMPPGYIEDWLKVADEEAYHFQLMREHLNTLGYDYGDFDAHNGLWEMAQKTAHDPLVRMALVPRVMEARGLDVTPGIIDKLREINDQGAIEVLDIIHRDEVGHVEIGTRWFHYLCDQRNLPRQETFEQLFGQYTQGRVRLPLHRSARKEAGFTEAELTYLEGLGC